MSPQFWVRKLLALTISLLSWSSLADERVTILGASHSLEGFGERLEAELLVHPWIKTSRYAAGGVSSKLWAEGWLAPYGYYGRAIMGSPAVVPWDSGLKVLLPKVPDLLKMNQTTLTIVALGTNELWYLPHDSSTVLKGMQSLLDQIFEYKKDMKCIWIGPPGFKTANSNKFKQVNLKMFYGLLKSVESRCAVFTGSQNFVADATDGIHFQPNGAAASAWAKQSAQFVLDILKK